MSEKEGVWKIVLVAMLGPFMSQLDSTVINLSLATIREELHASIASAQWIVSGYLLALALMLPLSGWLVDRIGAKRLYLGCFSAFTLASFLCARSGSIEALILARVLQGMAGGILAPMAQMMIARVAGKQMAKVMGYAAVPILFAPILGPVIAGAILKYAPWPWLFYLNLPVGILALALAAVLLPDDRGSEMRRPFDLPGFLVISPALACLLYGFEEASHHGGGLFLVAGIMLLAVFLRLSYPKGERAIIDLHLFGNRIFTRAAATQFLSNGQAYAGQFLVPLYLITDCGLSASRAGWMLAPMGFGMMCSFPLMGYLTERFGCRTVSSCGALLALLGTCPFLWMVQHHYSPVLTACTMLIRGAGQGAIGIPSVSAAYASIPKEKLSGATTAINIVQRLGGPLATTVTAIVMSLAAGGLPAAGPRPFLIAFVLLAGLHTVALASATRLPERVHQG